ncbi:hypothetical protein ACIRBY_34015 [Streptomyces sp. NPDC096136]|uniref:TRADD-N-associated membrane domain-containing protein n=1 Tax=Streptomyces sp. NPDC096136 TaxID=3366076 RepID=UPI00382C93D9
MSAATHAKQVAESAGVLERIIYLAGFSATGMTMTALIATLPSQGKGGSVEALPTWFLPVTAAIVVLFTVALGAALILREQRKTAVQRAERERFENAADHLQERMELASLVNFNRILLDRYHGIATKQANKSFYSSIGAMIVGLLVLVVAFIASMQFNALGERIFIGSLAAVSTAFVGYLSKTFMVVYDRSLQQLNQYFNQPVINQYFLSAERIVDRLEPPMRDELLAQIAKDVLTTGMKMHEVGDASPALRRSSLGRQRGQASEQQPPAPAP